MKNYLTTASMIRELSDRIKQIRIDYPLTQNQLADKSGVSIRSISRFENGEDIKLSNLIKILYALDLSSNLDALVPDYKERPSFYLADKKKRHRVRISKTKVSERQFKWGDEK